MRETTKTIGKALFTISIPFLVIYFLVWQSISFANLNREVKKLSQKREELFKKNHDLKSRIASSTSIERIDTLYKKNNKNSTVYPGNKIVTLTLPKEKSTKEKDK
jgi:cell division protein FtsL